MEKISQNDNVFDVNKFTAEFLTMQIKNACEAVPNCLKSFHDFINTTFRVGYRKYLEKIGQQYSYTKSFFCSAHPVYLYYFFVVPNLQIKNKIIPINVNNFLMNRNIPCISGSAGCGKSILMKHLFLQSIAQANKLTVFFELKEINSLPTNLIQLIKNKLEDNGLIISEENIQRILSHGDFIIFLDGFDELNYEYRNELLKQITLAKNNYPDLDIIISSRHDDSLIAVNNISIMDIAPFNLEQACELIEKLPYEDIPIKEKFLNDLKTELFKKHKSFLSNPLLLTIMLLTYGENAHIPDKITIFYGQAYEALFSKHDARKSAFKRKIKSGLDINDFAKVFSCFCFLSLKQGKISFSETDIYNFLTSVKSFIHIDFSNENFLEDLIQSICLMLRDGLNITFSHRSFQEYFAACYIKDIKNIEIQIKCIDHFFDLNKNNVVGLLWELDPRLIDECFVIPKIQSLRAFLRIKKKVSKSHVLKLIKKIIKGFHFDKNGRLCGFEGASDENYFFDFIWFNIATRKRISSKNGIFYNMALPKHLLNACEKNGCETYYMSVALMKISDLSVDFLSKDGYFGIETLQNIINLENELLEKYKTVDSNLDDLFRNKICCS